MLCQEYKRSGMRRVLLVGSGFECRREPELPNSSSGPFEFRNPETLGELVFVNKKRGSQRSPAIHVSQGG